MTEPFSIRDHRSSQRTASGIHLPGANWDATANNLRSRGYTLPTSGTQARLQARQVVSDVRERGTVADVQNKAAMHAMRANRLKNSRMAGGGMQRTGANVQMVLPKVRQPLSSLMDKGIPFNTEDPKELQELRRWTRLFYATHDLVPLLIDIYSTFPVQGMELQCQDKKVEEFFTGMFLDELDYGEFLPNGLMREYFMVGEATSLAHFNEQLGTWSSEELLNPDWIRISKSLFVEQERVQLMPKALVESLRDGPQGMASSEESHSERLERTFEYQSLVKHYPEIIKAAQQDDGLDISDALVSRMVNKAAWWDLRGTPHLLRSFRTLMLEESLNAAQDAVCQVAKTPVLTDNGVCYIEDVKADDSVLTHKGRYQKVLRTMKREADEAGVTLRWWYDQPLTLTGEHPVYVRRPINMPLHHYHGKRHTEWAEGFVPAREVQVYDQVLHPSSPSEEKVSLALNEHLDHNVLSALMSRVVRVCGEEFKVTPDLLWLIGLHVADGCANSKSIRIVLGENESEIAARAGRVFKDVFGLDAIVKPTGSRSDGSRIKSINVELNSTVLGPFFREMCGSGDTKRFPSWAFGLTPDQTTALIQGWMDGDGTTDEVRTLGSSAYRCLQESVAWLMRRSGLVTSSRQARRQGGYSGSGCQYTVTTVKTPRRAYPADQGGYWAEVRSVDHHQVTETVYNLEVAEDNSYCVPIAVHNCDRLYAPLIVATLGIEGAMGDGEPWIPDQGELEDLRDDIQAALAADFKLIVHNFGLSINPVFGRESVPRFDQDYDRVDAKLMQAWGIGQALIMGGSGAGTYASSAINREVCEQLMKSAQNKAIKHMRKRMEVIAEAQEFYDFDLKGGRRIPVYEHIEEYNEETGEKEIVKVPKLLIPDVRFATLNLRDEATERSFVAQLKQMGVPVSDKSLAINIPFEFEEELERQSQETVDKGRAQAEAMGVLQEMLDEEGLPYPMELAQHLEATLGVRAMLAQTEAAEAQNKMMDQQLAQASPAGMMGLLPGTTMQPLAGGGAVGMAGDPTAGAAPGGPPPPDPAAGPAPNADPTLGQGHPAAQLTATMHGPRMWPPGGEVEPPEDTMSISDVPRNRNRPEESDEKRGEMPKKVGGRRKKVTALPGRGEPDPVIINSRFTKGPSSYRQSRSADQRRVERAVRRREVLARGGPTVAELVFDPDFYHVLHADGDQAALEADWPEIEAGRGGQSRRLLEELIEQYEAITGIAPRWE